MNIMRANDSGGEDTSLRLDFKGFEIKTVKLVVATERVVYLRRKSFSYHQQNFAGSNTVRLGSTIFAWQGIWYIHIHHLHLPI